MKQFLVLLLNLGVVFLEGLVPDLEFLVLQHDLPRHIGF